ncbi:hypothetical protein MOV08_27835 [Streptomyces yunnanensis]|uniref:PRC-barrel domain-containing protein n=1 Tax=Streptomyces yunnanensis TaxID=156453 RepID=A0ABY8ACH4_9ACTN|nr:hypothetical protein [Streptomyces yunnanensis]WEB42684.1 hypothetical protein MOV08_27835 [Streptomyces yunnanensis]
MNSNLATLVGQLVCDEATGRIGVLKAVDDEWIDPAAPSYWRRTQSLAFIRPERGGREWTTCPEQVRQA